MKKTLAIPPVYTRQYSGKVLYIYLVVVEEVVSVILIREPDAHQRPVYYISKALAGVETRYQKIGKVALALVTPLHKLRHYFLIHFIIV